MDDGEASPEENAPETLDAAECAGESFFQKMRRHWMRWVAPPAMVIVATIGIVADVGGVAGLIWPQPAPLVLTEGSKDTLISVLQQQISRLESELDRASKEDRTRLQMRIDVLVEKLANIDEAYREALEENRQLRLTIRGLDADVPEEKLIDALRALHEEFDRSKADALLAEIEQMERDSVERTARASFARGEIAEAEVRWPDAAEHYARAARLDPTIDTLFKARALAWRAGDYPAAIRWGEDLLALVRRAGTHKQLATALNEHAVTVQSQGRYEKAEGLYLQALEIDKATIGEAHPDYATRLSNLAGVVFSQGRTEEAEGYFRKALEIGKGTIGEAHPDYAIHLNNLGLVLRAQGRNEEAEELFRQALEIDQATIGEAHPDHATHLNNLALVVLSQGRTEEAEGHFRQAVEISKATIGEAHPSYAIRLWGLGVAVEKLGRPDEAEALYEQALAIFVAKLGPDHPQTKGVRRFLDNLPVGRPND